MVATPQRSGSRWVELDKVICADRGLAKRTTPSVPDRGRRYPASAKARSCRHRSVKDGNILLYGSPGTGRDHFPPDNRNGFGPQAEPENLTMYLLDFGTNGLAPLTQLPHVADSLLLDQTEKIQKFIRIINRELDRRKKLLSEHGSALSPSTVK